MNVRSGCDAAGDRDEQPVQDERSGAVGSIEAHRSQKAAAPKISCQQWFDKYLANLCAQGHERVEGAAVREAGKAAGYSLSNLYVASNARGCKGKIWPLTGSKLAERVVAGRTRRHLRPVGSPSTPSARR